MSTMYNEEDMVCEAHSDDNAYSDIGGILRDTGTSAAGVGMYFGAPPTYITEEMILNSLPDVVDSVHLPGGKIQQIYYNTP